MYVFKVWSADRKHRKAVINSTFCVEEVISKAGEKLGIPPAHIDKLVLEQDGTEIDENELLEAYQEKTLLLMRKNEEWRPEGVYIILDDDSVDNCITGRIEDNVDQKPVLFTGNIQAETTSGSFQNWPPPSAEDSHLVGEFHDTSIPHPLGHGVRDSTIDYPDYIEMGPKQSSQELPPIPGTSMLDSLTSHIALGASSTQPNKTRIGQLFTSLNPHHHYAEYQPTSAPTAASSSSSRKCAKRPASDLSTRKETKQHLTDTTSTSQKNAIAYEEVHVFRHSQRVLGVAHVSGKLYFIDNISIKIGVYSDTAPYTRFPSLVVRGLRKPRDISAYSQTESIVLFVLDASGPVWRIELSQCHGSVSQKTEKHINLDGKSAGSLSVLPGGRLLIVNLLDNEIQMYGPEGDLQKTISLNEQFEGLLHAVMLQTPDSCLLISHGLSAKHRVCKLKKKGKKVLNSHGDEKGSLDNQVDNPSYMAVQYKENGGVNCVFVADEHNNRVIVLDAKLALITVITEVDQPHRLCYVDERKLLVVACNQEMRFFKCP